MTLVDYVRHGESKANITKEFSYKLVDYPLTSKGKLQAQQTGDYFKNKEIHKIFSSPLKRAIETAVIIASCLNLDINIIENFREINVGSLEGKPVNKKNWDIYFSIINDWYNGNHRSQFPKGEDYDMLLIRMLKGLKQAVQKNVNEKIIIVGHGGIFKVVLKTICHNVNIYELKEKEIPNCSITKLKITINNEKLKCKLLEWNMVSHLHGEAAKLISGLPALNDEDF